jgi:sugar phosphate isomerase/epimerase
MIKLSYSTFGLTNLDFLTAIDEVEKAGYPGIEISFHRDQFNPFDLSDDDLAAVKKRLDSGRVKAACVATASHFFTPQRPHEPSLMTPDLAGRKRRIELVKRGIHVARKLGVNLVTFGSGFIRDEHVSNPSVNPRELLIDSIQQCIAEIRPDEDITLLIEPEPGMFIETMEQGLSLMHEIDSPRFRLHIDLLHSYCSEQNYVEALAQAAPHIRYLHVSDAQQGYNLKIVKTPPTCLLTLILPPISSISLKQRIMPCSTAIFHAISVTCPPALPNANGWTHSSPRPESRNPPKLSTTPASTLAHRPSTTNFSPTGSPSPA